MKTVIFLQIFLLVHNVAGIILISPSLPEIYERATISCYSVEKTRTWFHKEARLSICNNQGCLPNAIPQSGYTFTGENDKTEVTISSLDRTRDGGLWTCFAGVSQSIILDVYSFPSGLSFTQGGDTEVDLAESQTILQCQTEGCTYPAPIIRWYFKETAPSAPRTFYNNTGTQVTGGRCTSPEELYTSRLFLPRYTTWQGNIDKNVTLSCGIEYSDVSRNVYSQESKHIRYAVRVTEAVIQQNNHNITEILNVTAGVPVTLACLTGTSRPPATIAWYLGSQSKDTGAIWNFTPTAADHKGVFYCQGYNTDLSQKIDSNKARLYVRVPIDSVQLRNGTALTLNEGQLSLLICETGACRPSAAIYWMKNGVNITDSPTFVTVIIQPNDLFVSMGTINYTGQREDNGESLTCGAFNGLDSGRTSEILTLNIFYAANITEFVTKGNITETLENSTLEFYCHVDSNPYSVISLYFGDVLISTIQDARELIHTTTVGCLNAGKYICSATNSVMNGVTVSADINIKVQCSPRLDIRKDIITEYYGALTDNVTLAVNVIAYPEPTDIMWYHKGATTGIWQPVPNQPNVSNGLFSSLKVHLGDQGDYGDYLVNMPNKFGIYHHIFHVMPESPPQLVDIFCISRFLANQIEFHFKPGFNGGHAQTFAIEYKSTASPDSPWKNSSATDLKELKTPDRTHFVNVTQPPPGNYEFRMYSWNDIGRSPNSLVITVFIAGDTLGSTNQIMLIVSIVLFCLAACLFIAALVLFFRSRKDICSGCKNYTRNKPSLEEFNDIGLGQEITNDGVSNVQADTGEETRHLYEDLNNHALSTPEYEKLSKGSERQSKTQNHLYSNMIHTSTM